MSLSATTSALNQDIGELDPEVATALTPSFDETAEADLSARVELPAKNHPLHPHL